MLKFKNLFKTKECDHTHNFRSLKYKLKDGTPMYEFECYDCGYKDKGCVYADGQTWDDKLVIKRNGVQIN